jgi:hypothetical protein
MINYPVVITKQHIMLLCQFPLARLSLVRIIPLLRYHRNILILRGTFSLPNLWFRLGTRARWCDFTENCLLWTRFQWNSSGSHVKIILAIPGNRLFHATSFGPIRPLRHEKFKDVLKTSAIAACLWCTILYSPRYCSRKEMSLTIGLYRTWSIWFRF